MSLADIWPDFQNRETRQQDETTAKPPLIILNEIALGLQGKTGGSVVAQVETKTFGELVLHSFQLVVPAKNNYTYRLFKVEQHGLDPYPVWIRDFSVGGNMGDGRVMCPGEAEFTALIGVIISGDLTIRLIKDLMHLSTDAP